MIKLSHILKEIIEGTCGYTTDANTNKKLNTPGGLKEGKQVGIIYHYTTFEAGFKILQSNQLKSGEAADSTKSNPIYSISFTRDKRFHDNHVVGFDESSIGNKPQLRFTIDGNKLSNRFKVQPYSQQGAFSKDKKGFEAEERVISNKPFTISLSDYLMSIDILLEYQKPSNEYDIIGIVNYEMYEPIRAKIVKFAQDKNLPINLIINKNGDPWPDKVKPTLIDKILNFFKKEVKSTDLKEADPKKGTGKKPKGSGRRLYTDENPKDTVSIKFKTKEDIVDTLNKDSFKSKSHARQSQIINLIHQRVRAAYSKAKDSEVKSRLKRALDYIEKRKESSKEKTKKLKND
jgi:hypothetical protein